MLKKLIALLTTMAATVLVATSVLLPTPHAVAATSQQKSSIDKGPTEPHDATTPKCNQRDFRCRDEQHRNGGPPRAEPGSKGGGGGKTQPCVSSATGKKLPCTSQWGSW